MNTIKQILDAHGLKGVANIPELGMIRTRTFQSVMGEIMYLETPHLFKLIHNETLIAEYNKLLEVWVYRDRELAHEVMAFLLLDMGGQWTQ